MAQPDRTDLSRYDMYHAFGTQKKARQREEKKKQSPTRPAKYTVRRAAPAKKQDDTVPSTGNQAIFHRQPPKRPDGVRAPAGPVAPSMQQGGGAGYVQVYGGNQVMRPVRKPKIQVITRMNKEKKPFPTSIVFGSLICTVLLLFFIYNFMQLSQYTGTVNDLSLELTVLKQKENELSLQIVQRDDLVKIAEYATENYGMVKTDSIVKKYVTVVSGDKTVITSDEEQAPIRRDTVEPE